MGGDRADVDEDGGRGDGGQDGDYGVSCIKRLKERIEGPPG